MLFREGNTFLFVPVTLLETSVISLFKKLLLSSPGSHLVILGHSYLTLSQLHGAGASFRLLLWF